MSEWMRTNLKLPTICKPWRACSLLIIGLVLNIANGASAKVEPTPKPLKVVGVETNKTVVKEVESNQGPKIALYHTVKVHVEELAAWVKEANHDPSKFILYIDGNAFKGLLPALVEDNTKLQFDLKRVPDNKDAWTAVLSRGSEFWERQVPVTVRQENVQVQGEAQATLTIIDRWWFRFFVGSFAAAIILFWWLAFQSDIIRDTGPQPVRGRKRYSLARTQMAVWFFTIIIAYVFIWMVTKDLTNLTDSALGLMGISAATGLGSAVVDSNKRSERENRRRIIEEKKKADEVELQKLQSEIDTLSASINANPAPANSAAQQGVLIAKQAELAAKQKEIPQTDQKIRKLSDEAKPTRSESFINDILSDDNGISFHRFQIVAWTIVLIYIFIRSVYNSLAMPEFDATLLGLMGISGGTYIGFKLPERQG